MLERNIEFDSDLLAALNDIQSEFPDFDVSAVLAPSHNSSSVVSPFHKILEDTIAESDLSEEDLIKYIMDILDSYIKNDKKLNLYGNYPLGLKKILSALNTRNSGINISKIAASVLFFDYILMVYNVTEKTQDFNKKNFMQRLFFLDERWPIKFFDMNYIFRLWFQLLQVHQREKCSEVCGIEIKITPKDLKNLDPEIVESFFREAKKMNVDFLLKLSLTSGKKTYFLPAETLKRFYDLIQEKVPEDGRNSGWNILHIIYLYHKELGIELTSDEKSKMLLDLYPEMMSKLLTKQPDGKLNLNLKGQLDYFDDEFFVRCFMETIKGIGGISHLDLSENNIEYFSSAQLKQLFSAIIELNITSLNLDNNSLFRPAGDPKKWEIFLEGIRRSKLTTLSIEENCLEPSEIKQINIALTYKDIYKDKGNIPFFQPDTKPDGDNKRDLQPTINQDSPKPPL